MILMAVGPNRRPTQGPLGARGPTLSDPEILTIEIVGEPSWDSTKTRTSLRTSGGTTPTSFPGSRGRVSHHLHQTGGQPLEHRRAPLARALGPKDTPHHPTLPPSLFLNLCRRMPVRPSLLLPPLQRRGRTERRSSG